MNIECEYAADAEFKLDLIKEILAAKEMYWRTIQKKKNGYLQSMGRNNIENYDIFMQRRPYLERGIYKVGLIDKSKKYTNLLGWYQSGSGYEKSYKIFNKNYEKPKIKTAKNKKTIIQRLNRLLIEV